LRVESLEENHERGERLRVQNWEGLMDFDWCCGGEENLKKLFLNLWSYGSRIRRKPRVIGKCTKLLCTFLFL